MARLHHHALIWLLIFAMWRFREHVGALLAQPVVLVLLALHLPLIAALVRARVALAPVARSRRREAKAFATVLGGRVPGVRRAAVAFVHPDLGIGGAERLIVDAAVGLAAQEHPVVVYTSHHDPAHAFKETCDGTLTVKVYGDFLPRSILGRAHILCATLRGLYLSCAMLLLERSFDVVVVDQLSAPIPVLLLSGARVIFYCHFPDLKLAAPGGRVKALYRAPFNWLEERTSLAAHRILVNSKFTMRVFHETFRTAAAPPEVLYPSINLEQYDAFEANAEVFKASALAAGPLGRALTEATCFVSINRFERKKNIALALKAFASLRAMLNDAAGAAGAAGAGGFKQLCLIIAGGYDARVAENVEYYKELEAEAIALGLGEQVLFKASFSEAERAALLTQSAAVVYTPSDEHFGIVPLEAMYCRRPVIAVNSGGPTESIVHEQTGILCDATPEAFAEAMRRVLEDAGAARAMGQRGRERVAEHFSLAAFAVRLHEIVSQVHVQ